MQKNPRYEDASFNLLQNLETMRRQKIRKNFSQIFLGTFFSRADFRTIYLLHHASGTGQAQLKALGGGIVHSSTAKAGAAPTTGRTIVQGTSDHGRMEAQGVGFAPIDRRHRGRADEAGRGGAAAGVEALVVQGRVVVAGQGPLLFRLGVANHLVPLLVEHVGGVVHVQLVVPDGAPFIRRP